MAIRIKNRLRKRKVRTALLATRFRTLLRSLGLPDAELSILFVGDRSMRTLNRSWRGKDKTTDVLSFPMREGRFTGLHPELLGDIVISVPVAGRQAKNAGHTLAAEIDRLLVHGLVHLLGYDHEQGPGEARRMARTERLLLKRLSA